jgi:Methyltransferase FkbM domain
LELGDVNGTATINISANSYSSSLLPVCERSLRIEPSIAYIGKQKVPVRRLDELLEGISRPDDSIYLKVDTQGYEMNVLKGALGIIGRFALTELETSFLPVYQSEALIGDAIKFLDYLGYRRVAMQPDWKIPILGKCCRRTSFLLASEGKRIG